MNLLERPGRPVDYIQPVCLWPIVRVLRFAHAFERFMCGSCVWVFEYIGTSLLVCVFMLQIHVFKTDIFTFNITH